MVPFPGTSIPFFPTPHRYRAGPGDTAQTAVETTLREEANRLNNAGFPAPLLAWQPHLRHVTDIALPRADELSADLGNTLGYHLYMVGIYAEAQHYFKRALAIREEVLGLSTRTRP